MTPEAREKLRMGVLTVFLTLLVINMIASFLLKMHR
jgi:hypothetical protein